MRQTQYLWIVYVSLGGTLVFKVDHWTPTSYDTLVSDLKRRRKD
jgi:hypothetical protein